MRDTRVLVVDDEPAIARVLRPALEGHDLRVITAGTGAEALAQLASFQPDVILLDLGLPDVDGVQLTGEMRKHTTAPIIVLSVRDGERDKVAALDNGASDYVTKPFSIGELMARVRVALRSREGEASLTPRPFGRLQVGDVVLDQRKHEV